MLGMATVRIVSSPAIWPRVAIESLGRDDPLRRSRRWRCHRKHWHHPATRPRLTSAAAPSRTTRPSAATTTYPDASRASPSAAPFTARDFTNGAVLNVSDSTFDHNQAIGGSYNEQTGPVSLAIGPNIGSGGGALIAGPATISDSTVDHNQAIGGQGLAEQQRRRGPRRRHQRQLPRDDCHGHRLHGRTQPGHRRPGRGWRGRRQS